LVGRDPVIEQAKSVLRSRWQISGEQARIADAHDVAELQPQGTRRRPPDRRDVALAIATEPGDWR
jgi:hypothetical protein